MFDFSTHNISLAPLQGFTDYIYRSAFEKYFGGVEKYYTPYVRYENNGELKASYKRDTSFENNNLDKTIPQILCNTGEDLICLALYFKEQNYKEVNWNLGCPYPMVANRKMGSGLLMFPEQIEEILGEYFKSNTLLLSIKMRLGYENPDEFSSVLKILNKFPINEIIIHPRIGKQLYKGDTMPSYFGEAIQVSKHKLIYNGDVTNVEKLEELNNLFPTINNWMIGRGLLANPFLAEQIKYRKSHLHQDALNILREFTNELLYQYQEKLSGQSHLLTKMQQHWIYISQMFENERKVLKLIKKTKRLDKYVTNTNEIFGGKFGGMK